MNAYNEDASLGKVDDVSDNYLEADHQLTFFRTSECILTAEIDTIVSAIGDDVGAQQPHSFKSSSFSIPTTCGYCKTSIWGLSKQGKSCKVCNLSVHSKCELKVPADCQGGSHRQASSASRLPTSSRLTVPASPQAVDTPTASSFVHSVPEEEVSYPVARVMFDFTSTSEFELSVSEGDSVNVLEPDDGSGWVKVTNTRGAGGLVPASYLGFDGAEASTPANQQGSGQYVKALYQYESRGSDEIGLKEGDLIELSSGPSGGQNYGEGWWEGYNSKGRKGIFPSNYVELV
ncbi:Protein BZZ1 [Stygiomarasmius scandens]|uniref:Protein BZZ1 n=1 Tax=Marasmiellus scandens TaxID=2682957 RepID=A0ABR1JZX6_9AGAR